ncbi:MAG: S8 family serine peptidase [Halanaerobiales bacterium]|nr:S8 family serine peptidase [Halanaerobiales bacterium]
MRTSKKYYILVVMVLVLILLTGCSSNGQLNYYNIKGTITTEGFNNPIENAEVSIEGKSTRTNQDGYYSIKKISEGTHNWKVSHAEYNDYSGEIIIDNDKIINSTLSLQTSNVSVNGVVHIYNSSVKYSLGNLETANSNNILESTGSTTSANNKYKKGEIIVNFKTSVNNRGIQKFEKDKGLNRIKSLNIKNNNIKIYKLPKTKGVLKAVERFNKLNSVKWAEPNYIYSLSYKPNDEYYNNQWGNRRVNLEAAWDIVNESRNVKVAVIDSGIIPNHEDLEANINFIDGKDFVDDDNEPIDESTNYSHGTHVSGIIGAVGNNGIGIAGVTWRTELLPIRVFDNDDPASSVVVAEAIDYAVEQNVDIINMSFAGPNESSAIYEAIKNAYNQGIIMVAASGNAGNNEVQYPARHPETIVVGATDVNNNITDYSNTGSNLDLVAPGGNQYGQIYSTSGINQDYIYLSGTSMSTPYVSGVAALLLANGVKLTSVRKRLTSTAVDLGTTGEDNIYGYGLVDAYGALLNKKLKRPYVFAATKENGSFNLKSELIIMNKDGSYQLDEVATGKLYLLAWRDVNENQTIDAGDYYGEYDSQIDFQAGGTYSNKDIDMFYVPDEDDTNIEVNGLMEIENR